MRDREDGMDENFWNNAEKLLGVGYGGAELHVTEEADPNDPDERFMAWVEPTDPKSARRHLRWDLRTHGGTRRYALERLSELLDRRVRTDAYKALREALPYNQWRQLAVEAELLLSVEYTVVLGSKTDDEEAIGMTLLRKSYWEDVRGQADALLDAIKSGEIPDSDTFEDHLHEIGVIYTSDAHKTVWFSDNDDAYEDEMGEKADTIEVTAMYALQADVRERVAASIDVQHLRKIDCPRCGKVVIWTDPDEDEECRKCGYPTSVEVSRAYVDPLVADELYVCETCRADHPGEALYPVDHRKDFTCDECGSEYTQPKVEPTAPGAPATTETQEVPDGDPEP